MIKEDICNGRNTEITKKGFRFYQISHFFQAFIPTRMADYEQIVDNIGLLANLMTYLRIL